MEILASLTDLLLYLFLFQNSTPVGNGGRGAGVTSFPEQVQLTKASSPPFSPIGQEPDPSSNARAVPIVASTWVKKDKKEAESVALGA